MKKIALLISLITLINVCGAFGAEPVDVVKDSAKKLGGKASYSWTSTSSGKPEIRMGPLEGKAEKNGFTYCKFTFADNQIETAFKGTKSALNREGQWESAEELEASNAAIARRLKDFKAPVAEAEDLADKAKNLHGDTEGLYSGELSPEGVKEVLSRWRRTEASGTKGTIKFWIKNGLLTKYEYNVQGTVTGSDQNEVEIDRTTTVEIKDVGATKVSVPEEAKKKLS